MNTISKCGVFAVALIVCASVMMTPNGWRMSEAAEIQPPQGEPRPMTSPTAPPRLDKTVIGRSFRVSNSVNEQCKHEPNLCSDVFRNLAKLAQEPREDFWAAKMEKIIQSNIAKQGPRQNSIRNIECRVSVCAVEVASLSGPYLIGRDDQLHSSLQPGLATLGIYETDASGARVTVTVETFTRR